MMRRRLPEAAISKLPAREDLRWVVWGTVASLLPLLLPLPQWQQVVLALPLVLVLPGYALTAALFPSRMPIAETIVYTIAFSFCTTAAGGVLTQLVLSLSHTVWYLLLVLVTLCAAEFADRRDREAGRRRGSIRLAWPGATATLLLAAALTITGASVVLATNGAHEEAAKAHFSELWILPEQGGGGEGRVTVGVRNNEGSSTSYALDVTNGKGESETFLFEIAKNTTRTFDLGTWGKPGPAPTVATLDLDSGPIRSVHLDPGTVR